MRDQLGYKNENNRNASIITVQHYCDIHITNKKTKEDLEPWGSNFEPVTLYDSLV
jgi:hypothetical protein